MDESIYRTREHRVEHVPLRCRVFGHSWAGVTEYASSVYGCRKCPAEARTPQTKGWQVWLGALMFGTPVLVLASAAYILGHKHGVQGPPESCPEPECPAAPVCEKLPECAETTYVLGESSNRKASCGPEHSYSDFKGDDDQILVCRCPLKKD